MSFQALEPIFLSAALARNKKNARIFFRKGRHVLDVAQLQRLYYRFDNPSSRSGQVALRHPVPRILPFR